MRDAPCADLLRILWIRARMSRRSAPTKHVLAALRALDFWWCRDFPHRDRAAADLSALRGYLERRGRSPSRARITVSRRWPHPVLRPDWEVSATPRSAGARWRTSPAHVRTRSRDRPGSFRGVRTTGWPLVSIGPVRVDPGNGRYRDGFRAAGRHSALAYLRVRSTTRRFPYLLITGTCPALNVGTRPPHSHASRARRPARTPDDARRERVGDGTFSISRAVGRTRSGAEYQRGWRGTHFRSFPTGDPRESRDRSECRPDLDVSAYKARRASRRSPPGPQLAVSTRGADVGARERDAPPPVAARRTASSAPATAALRSPRLLGMPRMRLSAAEVAERLSRFFPNDSSRPRDVLARAGHRTARDPILCSLSHRRAVAWLATS